MRRPDLVIVGVAGGAHAVTEAGLRVISLADAVSFVDAGAPYVDLTAPALRDRFLGLIPSAPRLRFRGRLDAGAYVEVPEYVAWWVAQGAKGAA